MAVSTSKFNYIDWDPELCIGCQICEYVCSYTKNDEYNTYRSRIRTVRVDEVLITASPAAHAKTLPVFWHARKKRFPRIRKPERFALRHRSVTAAPGVLMPAILCHLDNHEAKLVGICN